jgi:putative membrane protein
MPPSWSAEHVGASAEREFEMIVVGLVFAGLAALIHVYNFYLESLAWTAPGTRRVFGTTPEQADVTRPLAFNPGFYNLVLAITVLLGIGFVAAGSTAVGATLVFAGAGSMVAAGVVLVLSDRSKARAALIQLVAPLIGIGTLAVGLVG